MPISIDCPCGKRLLVSDKLTARQGQCPSCGRTLDIPAEAAAIEAPLAFQAVEVSPAPTNDGGAAPGASASQPQQATDGPWRPPAEVHDHGGAALPAGADFFVPPPAEIGAIVSAYTSLARHVRPTAPGTRAVWMAVACCAGAIAGMAVAVAAESPVPVFILGLPLGCAGMAVVLYASRFRYRCTYVGREGVARFRCSGSRGRLDVAEVFRFRDAAELRVSQTSRFVNGVYTGTDYRYVWTDTAGQPRYRIAGTHRYRNATPPTNDPYQYALAAEAAWSNYMLGQVRARLLMSGTIFFGLGGGDWVRLGERKLILCFKGETTEHDADDVAEVRIHQGCFEIRRKDAQRGWFSSTGIFKFPYGHLGNAQLFLFLLDQVVGVPISG